MSCLYTTFILFLRRGAGNMIANYPTSAHMGILYELSRDARHSLGDKYKARHAIDTRYAGMEYPAHVSMALCEIDIIIYRAMGKVAN